MYIFVNIITLEDLVGIKFRFDTSRFDTIKNFKLQIQVKEGIPVHKQRIFYSSTQIFELNDERSLSYYNIKPEATFFIYVK